MLHYFYVLKRQLLVDRIVPVLSRCFMDRSFAPLRELTPWLRIDPGEASLIAQAQEAAFDRHLWHAVVGQSIIFGACEMPRVPLELTSVVALVHPERLGRACPRRQELSAVEQIFVGSRDLVVGTRVYRPLHVGWNDVPDVQRLAQYLQTVDPESWSATALANVPGLTSPEDCEEELNLVRDWWPDLVDLYRRALASELVIICEEP